MIRSASASVAIVILAGCLVSEGLDGLAQGQPARARSRPAAASGPAPRRPAAPAEPVICKFPPAPATAPAAGGAGVGLTESVYQAALGWLDRADGMVDKLVPVAERAAQRLLAGGHLYVGGNSGFADECDFRAGGFPFTRIWYGQELEPNDVLLIGSFRPNEVECRYAIIDFVARAYGRRFGKAMVVHLSGHAWPQIARSLPSVNKWLWRDRLVLVDTGAPEGASMADACVGQMSATVLGWVLHGEILAAATRKGKTLATYASDWEPGGQAWDASVRGKHEHPKFKVPAIPAGKVGREYIKTCRRQVADFLATQPGQVRLAGRRMAKCMKAGGMVWAVFSGHIHPRGAIVPPELTRIKMFGRSYDWRHHSGRVPKQDMILWMGYLRYPRWAVNAAKRTGCGAVIVSVDDGPTSDRLTHIRGCWQDYDTVISLPEYPIRVLPSSGVVQTPQWYALMAETLAAYKALH